MASNPLTESPGPSLIEQATQILEAASQLQQQLQSHKLPQPTLEVGPRKDWRDASQHTSILEARFALIDASQAMLQLALGPIDYLDDLSGATRVKLDVLQTLNALEIAQAVPTEGDVAVAQLAENLGLNEELLQRLLSFAYAMGLFRESPGRKGHVMHTALSAAMPDISTYVRLRAEPCFISGVAKFPEAVRSRGESAVKVPAQLEDPMGRDSWRVLEEDYPPGQGMALFSAGMKTGLSIQLGASLTPYVRGLDWDSIVGGTVVDVGGGNGHVEVTILPQIPSDINFIIQDLPSNEGPAKALIEAHQAQGRITFQSHDFFQPQPAKSRPPTVFMLSRILHDWPDEDCVKIIRPLLPEMEHYGTKLWLCERVLPDEQGQISRHMETQLRMGDLTMFRLYGAKERTLHQWKNLVAKADLRLRVQSLKQLLDTQWSFFEVVLE